jgi:hypothetical protein
LYCALEDAVGPGAEESISFETGKEKHIWYNPSFLDVNGKGKRLYQLDEEGVKSVCSTCHNEAFLSLSPA